MEGVPKQAAARVEGESNIENLSQWRNMKAEAPVLAESLIAKIDDYTEMSVSEQISALNKLRDELQADNSNRYIEGVIAHRVEFLEATETYEAELIRLGIAA